MKNGQLTAVGKIENEAGTEAKAPSEAPPTAGSTNRAHGDTPSPLAARSSNGRLRALAEPAKNYARAARAENTRRAYDSDWRQFSSWLRRQGLPQLPPDPLSASISPPA